MDSPRLDRAVRASSARYGGAQPPRRCGALNGRTLERRSIIVADARHDRPQGRRVVDDHFLMFFNPGHEEAEFTIPDVVREADWNFAITSSQDDEQEDSEWNEGEKVKLPARTVAVLQAPREAE